MIRLHEKRLIERPVDEVFAYAADFANVAEWDPGVSESRRLDEGELGEGSRFAVTAVFGGRSIDLEYTMTRYVVNEVAVLEVSAPRFDAVDTITFGMIDADTTEVNYQADFELKGWFRYVELLLRGPFKRLGRKALDGLADHFA